MSADSNSILLSFQKIRELSAQLDCRENNEWMRLMKAPDYLRSKLHEVFQERESALIHEELRRILAEIEELLKIAAHHKFLNGNSVKIWSTLKAIHASLQDFEKSLNI